MMHPDLEMYLPRSAIEGTVYRGREGAGQAFDDTFDFWERIEFVGASSIDRQADDWYLTKTRVRGHTRGPGPQVEYDAWWLFRLQDGLVAYTHPYQDPDEALAAFDAR